MIWLVLGWIALSILGTAVDPILGVVVFVLGAFVVYNAVTYP